MKGNIRYKCTPVLRPIGFDEAVYILATEGEIPELLRVLKPPGGFLVWELECLVVKCMPRLRYDRTALDMCLSMKNNIPLNIEDDLTKFIRQHITHDRFVSGILRVLLLLLPVYKQAVCMTAIKYASYIHMSKYTELVHEYMRPSIFKESKWYWGYTELECKLMLRSDEA